MPITRRITAMAPLRIALALLLAVLGVGGVGSAAQAGANPQMDGPDMIWHLELSVDGEGMISSVGTYAIDVAALAESSGLSEQEMADLMPTEEEARAEVLADTPEGTTVEPYGDGYFGFVVETPPMTSDELDSVVDSYAVLTGTGMVEFTELTVDDGDVTVRANNLASGWTDSLAAGQSTSEIHLTIDVGGTVDDAPGADISGSTATWDLAQADSTLTLTGSTGGGLPVWLLIGLIVLGALVLIGGAVVLFFVLRRRGGSAANRGPGGMPGQPMPPQQSVQQQSGQQQSGLAQRGDGQPPHPGQPPHLGQQPPGQAQPGYGRQQPAPPAQPPVQPGQQNLGGPSSPPQGG